MQIFEIHFLIFIAIHIQKNNNKRVKVSPLTDTCIASYIQIYALKWLQIKGQMLSQ